MASCLSMRNERGKEKKDEEEDFHEKIKNARIRPSTSLI